MEFIKADGTKIRKESGEELLLRGVGLGGWLLPEGYMWKFYQDCDRPRRMEQLVTELCGTDYSKQFWTKYRERYITKQDIRLIAEQGFNCVRLPMNSRILYDRQHNEIRWKEEEITRIDEFLGWCEEYDIYVILDMHGAPGGQTGTNIDDCERDLPELFLEEANQEILCCLWGMLATRYAARSCIAGYDLMNEPLPNWFAQYNDRVMPLYRRLTGIIRAHDQKHMIILEGVHWATDFTIFDELQTQPLDTNLVLQFHKYWNCPDRDSIQSYLWYRDSLQMPLLMGEGGENNVEWYTGLFSMLRRENISYCFWSYKKMDTDNSVISFPEPDHWKKLQEYIIARKNTGSAEKLEEAEAIKIFDDFLSCIAAGTVNWQVIHSMEGIGPFLYPAEYYSNSQIISHKQEGALLRQSEPVTILFREQTGEVREPDYKRYGGEAQPKEEKLCVFLDSGDWVSYEFHTRMDQRWGISILLKKGLQEKHQDTDVGEEGELSTLILQIDGQEYTTTYNNHWEYYLLDQILLKQGKHTIRLIATDQVFIGDLRIEEMQDMN